MTLDPKTIIQSADIPSIPSVLQEVLALADNPRTTASQLEKLVSQEPALVAQLLRWVNSAFYSLPRRVSSVSHAMILLGFSTVKSIASGMILINAFDNISGLSAEYVNSIWKHTLMAANYIKIFAKKEPTTKQDDLFLAAMIHDVGYLVMRQYFRKKYDPLVEENPFPTPERENEELGVDHVLLGTELLTEWKFPEEVIHLVKHHHDKEEFSGAAVDIAYLELADRFAYEKDIETFLKDFLELEEEEWSEEFKTWFQVIKWSKDDLKDVEDRIVNSNRMVAQLIK